MIIFNMAAAIRAMVVVGQKGETMREQKRPTLMCMSILILIHLIITSISDAQPPPPPSLNNPPSMPELIVPADGQPQLTTTLAFGWKKSSDPDGDALTYDLYVCEDGEFITGCINETGISYHPDNSIYYAGITGSGTVLLIMGGIMIFMGIHGERRKISLLLAIMAIAGILLISCGSGGGGSSGDEVPANSGTISDEVGKTVSGLKSGTTYYWKVVAKDSFGGEGHSSVRSFQTQ